MPCPCEIYQALQNNTFFELHHLHQFWTTLRINSEVKVRHEEGSIDLQHFDSLVAVVRSKDDEYIRRVNALLDPHVYPDQGEYREPDVNESRRGRPASRASTSRNLSSWEISCLDIPQGVKSSSHSFSRGRSASRGRSSSRGRGSSYGRGRGTTNFQNTQGGGREAVLLWENCHKIPQFILPYIEGYLDVVGDGNCGFRVIADCVLNDQNQWMDIRRQVVDELLSFPKVESVMAGMLAGGLAGEDDGRRNHVEGIEAYRRSCV
ncbi:Unknown protein [Striga hermonthica]|uniref:OTU domain-containing protein n=1 Tax=Striga hermonthica TaxID=68872 RepID=A0A9N7NJ63_STRHE|nr:Unknown protein [Striga hermonthica]